MTENLADVSDQATKNEELFLNLALQNKKPEGPNPVGYCLTCGPDVPLPHPQRWCDAECREDWDIANRR